MGKGLSWHCGWPREAGFSCIWELGLWVVNGRNQHVGSGSCCSQERWCLCRDTSGARLAVSATPSPGMICPVFALGVSSEPGQERWNQHLASRERTQWHEFTVHMLGSHGMRVNNRVQFWSRTRKCQVHLPPLLQSRTWL